MAKFLPFLAVLFAYFVPSRSIQVNPVIQEEQLLWISGEDNVGIYRIPLLTYTPKGDLLAICEARKNGGGDAGPKFLATRRSKDKGQTWLPEKFILNDGPVVDGLNLGVVLVDDMTSTIFIFYQVCGHYVQCNISTQYYIKSTDDGITWTQPYNVSKQVGTKMFAGGPGYGIQKKHAPHIGRLILCGHSTLPGDGLFCLLSDDHGDTWRYGGSIKSIPYNTNKIKGDFVPDECQPLELPDGSIMVNVRNQYQYHCHCRMVVMSYDGADSFKTDDLRFDTTLVDPTVAASILYHHGVLFFSNPEDDLHRINLTLRWSYDNGTTWASALSVWPKASGYSTMMAIPNNLQESKYIYILYEKGQKSATETLSLAKISITGDL
ncbi:sialidase-1-like [Lytechinus variegatus]|uniref:sialidase-1-like n=1 Tax=Lytechinus variegatus TaxID=7654 RepID=UPI001BB232C2|nr:sialidase-1-like [Lytechinus variegatus]